MTTHELTRSIVGETLARQLSRFVSRHVEARRRRAEIRQTMHELHAMSDRDLADLGIHPCDIPRIAREAVDTKRQG